MRRFWYDFLAPALFVVAFAGGAVVLGMALGGSVR